MADPLIQIYDVATVVYNSWKVRQEDEPFNLHKDYFISCPNYRSILVKLSKQYEVICLVSEVYDKCNEFDIYEGMDARSIALEMWPGEEVTNDALLYVNNIVLSCGIIIEPSFESFYLKLKEAVEAGNLDVSSFNESYSKVMANLSFSNISTPIVTIEGNNYELSTMRNDDTPFCIISYCMQFSPSNTLSLGSLKSGMKEQRLSYRGIDSISESLRKSIFGKDGILSIFVITSPNSILLNPSVLVSRKVSNKIINYSMGFGPISKNKSDKIFSSPINHSE